MHEEIINITSTASSVGQVASLFHKFGQFVAFPCR